MDKITGTKVAESFQQELERATAENLAAPTNPTEIKTTAAPVAPVAQSESLFELPDGRKLPFDQAQVEMKSLYTDYTRKAQELAKLKENPPEKQSEKAPTTEKSDYNVADQALLAELKRLNVMTRADFEQEFSTRRPDIVKESASYTATQLEIKNMISDLEEEFDGVEGKPKVEGTKIVDFIIENKYPNLSPKQIAQIIYHDDFVRFEAQKLAGTNTPALPVTESVGAGVTTPPNKTAFQFRNGSAERGLREILGNAVS